MSAPRCLAGRWHGCYDTFNGVVLMMLVGLPLAALACCRRAAGVAPVRFAAFASMPRILALGAGCSVLVETAQYVLWLDRVSSVDDVLVNATGAVLAGLASRHWWRTPAEVPSQRPCPAPVAAG
ncbi:VanZ family protein [Micromonospora matsumotoense]|uniref:VanZ family protein n=1 Tax=Micromonospora matsumotoense TaxID=121616 RepID=UPI003D91DE49